MNPHYRAYLKDSDRPKTQRFEESPSWVGKSIMYLIGGTAVMAAIKFAVEKWHLL